LSLLILSPLLDDPPILSIILLLLLLFILVDSAVAVEDAAAVEADVDDSVVATRNYISLAPEKAVLPVFDLLELPYLASAAFF